MFRDIVCYSVIFTNTHLGYSTGMGTVIATVPPKQEYIDGLVQDCNHSSALALELLQSCTKPSICK